MCYVGIEKKLARNLLKSLTKKIILKKSANNHITFLLGVRYYI